MNREQQIEEMARAMCGFSFTLKCSECSDACQYKLFAKRLHIQGYCNASDVARKIFEDIKKFNHPPTPECKPVYVIRNNELVELEKKYLCGGVLSDE